MTIKDQGASINIKLSLIVPSKTNPRKHFNESALKEMAASIEELGLISPIVVRTPRNGKYEIVAGETRYRAAKLIPLQEIPCIVRELTDFQAMEIQVIENLHRNSLSPMEEAQGFKQLLDKSQDIAAYTIDELADKIGKSRTYVYDSLKLLELDALAVNALDKGMLNRSTALMVARLDERVQTSALEKLLKKADEGSPVSVRQAKDMIAVQMLESYMEQEADQMIASLTAQGLTVIDIRDPGNREEWANFGIGSANWRHKEGFVSGSDTMQVPDDRYPREAKDYLTEEDANIAVHLIAPHYDEVMCVKLYPRDMIEKRHQAALDAGDIPIRQESLEQLRTRLARERSELETTARINYASELIELVTASKNIQFPEIALKILFDLRVNDSYLYPNWKLLSLIGINNQDELKDELSRTTATFDLCEIAICYFISGAAYTPATWREPSFNPETDDKRWNLVLEIAHRYGMPFYPGPPAEQPATPPAAAQAQEDVAPEKPDPAIEEVGELSEEEASLASGEPAAQAASIDTCIVRTAAQVRLDEIKAKELTRRAKKESAKADQSTPAPLAPATGETTRSEVTA